MSATNWWGQPHHVYLDGELVEASSVHPSKHRFVGMFRPPHYPLSDGSWAAYVCDCGTVLWSVQALKDHWLMGHMDVPQYATTARTLTCSWCERVAVYRLGEGKLACEEHVAVPATFPTELSPNDHQISDHSDAGD